MKNFVTLNWLGDNTIPELNATYEIIYLPDWSIVKYDGIGIERIMKLTSKDNKDEGISLHISTQVFTYEQLEKYAGLIWNDPKYHTDANDDGWYVNGEWRYWEEGFEDSTLMEKLPWHSPFKLWEL